MTNNSRVSVDSSCIRIRFLLNLYKIGCVSLPFLVNFMSLITVLRIFFMSLITVFRYFFMSLITVPGIFDDSLYCSWYFLCLSLLYWVKYCWCLSFAFWVFLMSHITVLVILMSLLTVLCIVHFSLAMWAWKWKYWDNNWHTL